MRADVASNTAHGVAVARATIDRPAWTTGDAAADDRLIASLVDDLSPELLDRRRSRPQFLDWLQARTHFFDDAVTRALREGVDQIVILGAGYDGRAMRYRTPHVRFFEVDHPATQADKRRRLSEIGAALDGIVFVAADFTEPGLDDRLAVAGHDPVRPSLFVCEGVLRYLPEHWYRELLRVTSARAGTGGTLAVSVSTRERELNDRERAYESALAESGEPVLTVPPPAVALDWIADAGWVVDSVVDALHDAPPDARRGRLLVRAHPMERGRHG